MLAFLVRWLALALWRTSDCQSSLSKSLSCVVTKVGGSWSSVHRCTSFLEVSGSHLVISLNFFSVNSQLHHFLGPVFRVQQEECQCLLPRPYPWLSKTGVAWVSERASDVLGFSRGTRSARKATVPATSEIQVPVFTNKEWTHPSCCMVLPGCPIVIDSCALPLIWLITESQINTFKVTRNRQSSPVSLWQSFFTVYWGGKPVCCSSGQNFNHFKHCYVMLVSDLIMVVWSYAIAS